MFPITISEELLKNHGNCHMVYIVVIVIQFSSGSLRSSVFPQLMLFPVCLILFPSQPSAERTLQVREKNNQSLLCFAKSSLAPCWCCRTPAGAGRSHLMLKHPWTIVWYLCHLLCHTGWPKSKRFWPRSSICGLNFTVSHVDLKSDYTGQFCLWTNINETKTEAKIHCYSERTNLKGK